jgi:hypothetical protein
MSMWASIHTCDWKSVIKMIKTATLYYNKSEGWLHTLFANVVNSTGKSVITNHSIQATDPNFNFHNTITYHQMTYGDANVKAYMVGEEIK